MDAFTIKDLENLSGVKAHTLRIWEQRYCFLKPCRTDTNIRYYSREELKAVLNISLLNRYGFKVSRIEGMKPGDIEREIETLADPIAVRERQIHQLIRVMIDLDIEKFEKILCRNIELHGIQEVMPELIYPFLERTGLLWGTGWLSPVQGHLIINVLRQKLLVAIETLPPPPGQGPTALLFLPENEYHETGLLFIYYMLKKKGFLVIYLGPNVPIADVAYIAKLKNPFSAFIHVSGIPARFNMEKYLLSLRQRLGGIRTIISGQRVEDFRKKTPPSIELKRSLPELLTCLSDL